MAALQCTGEVKGKEGIASNNEEKSERAMSGERWSTRLHTSCSKRGWLMGRKGERVRPKKI